MKVGREPSDPQESRLELVLKLKRPAPQKCCELKRLRAVVVQCGSGRHAAAGLAPMAGARQQPACQQ